MKEYIKNLRNLKQKRLSISIGTLAIILMAMVIANVGGLGGIAEAGVTPIANVFVTNTNANPVPVNVTNTTNVNVTNTITNPVPVRDVDNARQPFFESYILQFKDDPATGEDSELGTFTVPQGKRLVIEFVSAKADVPPGQKVIYQIYPKGYNAHELVFLTSNLGLTFSLVDELIADQQMKVYVDSGSEVAFDAVRNSASGTGTAVISFSGYYEDVP